ncbi:DUF4097 domain-containing protein [Glycomyces sp. TRM65418]|uniref:DUF4097 family beta strand repeat-containing protein n=1 Tax=Glycomyces sp. TRM65418 TaxID=2867006 RepID=UPI001CE60F52|nr:DUF4097 family beta strand repeat-containing protein [Glycomyces sp. TRM65418]MCC3763984.1 DUF4097 domain-containing protein [Glycomyces sp. TRM65418]QZD53680.1 DUF4097 domain-containing protein [Glycomyces sp. TRM65418]
MIDTPEKPAETPRTEPTDQSNRKVWWIVGGIVTAAVLLSAMSVVGVWIWTVSSPEERSTHTEEYTQDVTGIDLVNEVGDIDLTAADGNVLEVHREASWRGAEPEVTEEVAGDVVAVEADCDDGFAFFGSERCEVEFGLLVPAGVDAEVDSSIGEVHLDGLDGDIEVETSVGDVEGRNLRATSTEVDSDVGTVTLEYAEVLGDITVTTSTGDVVITVPDDGTTYEVVFESGVGSQNIGIATDPSDRADHVIRVSTSVGDLSVRYAE